MMKFIIKNKNSVNLNVKVMKYLIQKLKNVKKQKKIIVQKMKIMIIQIKNV